MDVTSKTPGFRYRKDKNVKISSEDKAVEMMKRDWT